PIVARGYLASFDRASTTHANRRHATFKAKTLAMRPVELPEVDLSHVRLMTDDTGMLQHATFTVPRSADGYCTDDNARALLVTTLLEENAVEPVRSARALPSPYLASVNT